MKNKIFLILGLVVLMIILIFVFKGDKQEVAVDDPMNVVLDFYDPWLDALKSSSTPFALGLADNPILSEDLRNQIMESEENTIDPVLCQISLPENITARPLSDVDGEFKVLVKSAESDTNGEAIVTLQSHKGGWFIEDILCSAGEFAPDREFNFEEEGFFLKNSEAATGPGYLHVGFEGEGENGHAVAAFLAGDSICISLSGKTEVCKANMFTNPVKTLLKGNMTELGVEVKRLEWIK